MEISVNELRIGNLTNLGEVVEINKVDFYVRNEDGENFKSAWADIKPIPLTEEWLLKIGFKLQQSNDFEKLIELKQEGNLPWHISIKPGGELYFIYRGSYIRIESVHKLQNIFYCLTETELTINQITT